MITDQPNKPTDTTLEHEPFCSALCALLRGVLISVEMGETPCPVVCRVSYVCPVEPLRRAAQLYMVEKGREVAPVVINMRVADPQDPDGLRVFDLDLKPRVGLE